MSFTEQQIRAIVKEELRRISKKLYMLNWRENHQEHLKEYALKYRDTHTEQLCQLEKKRYHKNRELNVERRRRDVHLHPEKLLAQNKARYFFRNLKTKECEFCGSTRNVLIHHLDYNYPFIVVFVCRRCHSWGHKDMVEVEIT